MKREKNPHALQNKVIKRATSKVVRKTVGSAQAGLTFKTLTSVFTKSTLIANAIKSLDITLNNPAGICR